MSTYRIRISSIEATRFHRDVKNNRGKITWIPLFDAGTQIADLVVGEKVLLMLKLKYQFDYYECPKSKN